MISFNVPPYIGMEKEYIAQAIASKKICGDGMFTKRCSAWLEEKTGTAKALLTTSCTHATEMAALLANIQPGDEVINFCIYCGCVCASGGYCRLCGYSSGYYEH